MARVNGLKELLKESNGGEVLYEAYYPFQSIKTAVSMLVDMGLADPEKVRITGFSTGIQVANYGMIHSDVFAAASLSSAGWVPIGYYFSAFDEVRDAFTLGSFGRPGGGFDDTFD